MSDQHTLISKAFQTFMTKAPAQAWAEAIQGLGKASALDPKTATSLTCATGLVIWNEPWTCSTWIPRMPSTFTRQNSPRRQPDSACSLSRSRTGSICWPPSFFL